MATKHFLGGRIILGTEFAGYKYRVFDAGTSTPKTTYKVSALTAGQENTDPVVLDANGACQIWFNGNADVVFYTSADVVVYSDDDVNLESSTSSAGAYNAVLNGSFEDDTDGDGNPDSWTITLYTGGSKTLDTTAQSHGDTSIKFTSVGTGGGYAESTNLFPVSPSEPYELSWDMKSDDAGVRNLVQIFWYKADSTASATASATALDDSTTNQTSWAREVYNATAPADAYFAKIRLTGCHSSDATSGSTWFDNVEFLHAKTHGARTNAGAVTQSGLLTMSGKSIWTAEGADVASASDCNIWSAGDGNTVHVTGTTTITDWGTAPQAGASMWVIFDGALQLTYNATTNKINTAGSNYTTIAGDRALVYAESTSSYVVTIFPFNGYGLTRLNGGTVSSAATLDIVMTSYTAYKNKKLVLTSFVPATDGVQFYMQFSTDGGGTFLSTNEYSWAVTGRDESGGAPTANANGSAAFYLFGNVQTVGSGSGRGVSAYVELPDTTSTTQYPISYWEGTFLTNGTLSVSFFNGGGRVNVAQDTDAVRILFSSGNIASGTWALYGYN